MKIILKGKLNDSNKELKVAKKDQIKIVSPSWLEECEKASNWLDEDCFQSSYDPNKSLDVSRDDVTWFVANFSFLDGSKVNKEKKKVNEVIFSNKFQIRFS